MTERESILIKPSGSLEGEQSTGQDTMVVDTTRVSDGVVASAALVTLYQALGVHPKDLAPSAEALLARQDKGGMREQVMSSVVATLVTGNPLRRDILRNEGAMTAFNKDPLAFLNKGKRLDRG